MQDLLTDDGHPGVEGGRSVALARGRGAGGAGTDGLVLVVIRRCIVRQTLGHTFPKPKAPGNVHILEIRGPGTR